MNPATKDEIEQGQALAKLARLDFVDLARLAPDTSSPALRAAVLPEKFARRNHVVPIGWNRGTPVIAIATPENVLTLDDIRAAIGREIKVVIASRNQIDEYLEFLYGASSPSATEPVASVLSTNGSNGTSAKATHKDASDNPEPSAERASPAPSEPAEAFEHSDGASTATSEDPLASVQVSEAARRAYLSRIHGSPPYLPDEDSLAPEALVDAPAPEGDEDSPIEVRGAGDEAPDATAPPGAEGGPGGEIHHFEDGGSDNAPVQVSAEAGAGTEAGAVDAALARAPRPASDWFSDALRTPAEELRLDDIELPEPVEERPKIGIDELLVEWGKVSPADMAIALAEFEATGRSLREIIAELRLVSPNDLLHAVAVEAGFEFVDLNNWHIDDRAADLIPESISRRYKVIGIGFQGDRPIVGIANPFDVFALDDVRTVVGGEIDTVVCPPDQIEEYLGRLYSQSADADLFARDAAVAAGSVDTTVGADVTNLLTVVDDAPIVKFVNLILRQALNQRASDIHIEPAVDNVIVRFRIDGVLHHVTSAPKAIQGGVTSRLKIMADLDIAEHRIPQDGRISLRVGTHEIDLRVATLPTVHGEKIALRVLDKSSVTLDLVKLGFLPDTLERFEKAYRKPYGTILVTGPTGSGKSTTLYAALSKLNSAEKNLITVEDPVEYQLRGVNQVQVSPKAGLSFASALRSILRSDPDVVLVGEIRDRDTATTAIEAALTGHLVLSCVHTNDAAGTPMRLIEMGVEPFLVGSALDCVLGQRLARVLCNNCAEDYEPSHEDLDAAGLVDDDLPSDGEPHFRRAVGCQACSHTGYHGRISIQEVMIVTEEIERAVVTRLQTSEIERLAVEQGMRTMRHDGLRKAALGLTSIEEILRVVI